MLGDTFSREAAVLRVLLAAWAVLTLSSSPASARVILVPEDIAFLLDACDSAVAGDTISVAPGTYTDVRTEGSLAWVARLNPGVSLQGRGAPEETVLDGTDLPGVTVKGVVLMTGVFQTDTSIENLTIRGLGEEIGIRLTGRHEEELAIRDCAFVGEAGVRSTAMRIGVMRNLIVEDCDFDRTLSALSSGAATIRRCEFRDSDHGAVFCSGTLYPGGYRFEECRFLRNRKDAGDGAAIEIEGAQDSGVNVVFDVRHCLFEENVAQGALTQGGAIAITDEAVGTIEFCTFVRDSTTSGAGGGGAIYIDDGDAYPGAIATIRSCTFVDCYAGVRGSAILVADNPEPVRIEQCLFWKSRGVPPIAQTTSNVSGDHNAFWENDDLGADWPYGPGSLFTDPLLCPGQSDTFFVRENSFCLDENNWPNVGQIGAWSAGCPGDGRIPYGVRASRKEIVVQVDGVNDVGGGIYLWEEGSAHTISTESAQIPEPGYRYNFLEWSDGGDRTHDITVGAGPEFVEAAFGDIEVFVEVIAETGGAVSPSAWVPQFEFTEILATPEEGYLFDRWTALGSSGYNGPQNPVEILAPEPITQIASFLAADVELATSSGPNGTVIPATGIHPRFSEVDVTAVPDHGYELAEWFGSGDGSYSGADNPVTVTMNERITQYATFRVANFELETIAEPGGSVTPETGEYLAFTEVEIEAIPDGRHVFRDWRGSGEGSYTGTQNPVTVSVEDPVVTQVAAFDPVAYEMTLSLSDTDPDVHSGAPIGLGDVYLWLKCGTGGRGVFGVELSLAGNLAPVAFVPEPGVVSSGGPEDLSLFLSTCTTGPQRLGRFVVFPPGEGSLCLDLGALSTALTIEDCGGELYTWPDDVLFNGVDTAGRTPCRYGRGCDGEEAPVIIGAVDSPIASIVPAETALRAVWPNPSSGETTIEFDVASPQGVRVEVFDVGGRRVRQLHGGATPAGRHVAAWDGKDERQRVVSAGVYFVRLTTAERTETKKVTRVVGR